LFIIDFDISVRVDGPDALIDCWWGTPEWMAPEIVGMGPKSDLWSCGLALRDLASQGVREENSFKTFRELLTQNRDIAPCYICKARSQ
jgi:serine/threonine protein kinase